MRTNRCVSRIKEGSYWDLQFTDLGSLENYISPGALDLGIFNNIFGSRKTGPSLPLTSARRGFLDRR